MKTLLFLCLCANLCSANPLTEWFGKPPSKRGPIPALVAHTELKTPEDINKARAAIWKAYREGAIQQKWDRGIPTKPGGIDQWTKDKQIHPLVTEVGEKKMPYIVLAKGKKPKDGWPVFFCLHGGGGNAQAKGPHSWQVNTREWLAQMRLATRVWDAPGLYIIPRMADDRKGRWYYGYNQIFIDRLIQQAILFNDANPDKIYLQGISEGGYAAFRLGSMMADRWAGACAMAAAEPIGNAPVENLQHVAFRCGIGEKDTMFDRIGLARTYFQKLGELQKIHPQQFIHFFDEQKGKGHGIDYQPGPAWIAKHTRNAVPTQFHWTVIKQHDRHRNRLYWLSLDQSPAKFPLNIVAHANKKNNTVNITAKDSDGNNATDMSLRIYLSHALVELSQPVTITVNSKVTFKGMVLPSMNALIRSTAERGDPKQVFPAQVKIKL